MPIPVVVVDGAVLDNHDVMEVVMAATTTKSVADSVEEEIAPTCVARAFFAHAGGLVCFFLITPAGMTGGGGTFSPPSISASTSPSALVNLCSCIGEVSVNALSSCGIEEFCTIGTIDADTISPPLLPSPIVVARGEVAGEGTKGSHSQKLHLSSTRLE